MMSAQQVLPEFKPPSGLRICQLGEEENWPKLMAILHEFRNFVVVDARSEDHLRGIAREIHASREIGPGLGWSILHNLTNCDGHHGELMMKDLLALGIDPDQMSNSNRTPAHWCAMTRARIRVNSRAEVIGMCRPDLAAEDTYNGNTPVGMARFYCHPTLWDFVTKGGFPTIAQLAHDKKWWAVQNLTRRRVVPDAEKFQKYAGKNAIEWAEHHEEKRIADELRYLLIGDGVDEYFREWLFRQERQLAKESKRLEAMLEKKLANDQQVNTEVQAIADKKLTAFGVQVSADMKAQVKEETALSTSKLADELRAFVKAEIAKQSSRAEQDRKVDFQGLEDKLTSKVEKCQAKLEEDMNVLKEGITLCTSRIGEVSNLKEEFDERMLNNEAVSKPELQDLKDTLLSKVDAKLEKFQQEFQELKRTMNARDEMAEAQMKAVREEVAKLSITAAGYSLPGMPTSPDVPQDAMAMQGDSASQSKPPIRSTDDFAAANNPMITDLLAVIEKYRR